LPALERARASGTRDVLALGALVIFRLTAGDVPDRVRAAVRFAIDSLTEECSIHNAQCSMPNAQGSMLNDSLGRHWALRIAHWALGIGH